MKDLLKKAVLIAIVIKVQTSSAQTIDTNVCSGFYLSASIVSRIGHFFDVGFEKISHGHNNIYYSSMASLALNQEMTGLKSATVWHPKYFGVAVQPLHLLIGKSLKFETGPSIAYQYFSYNHKEYPIDTTNNGYNNAYFNRLKIFYSIGVRYWFRKPGIMLKVLCGPRLLINTSSHEHYFDY